MSKKTAKIPTVWLIAILMAFCSPAIGYLSGKAGDCQPGQIDGQCGLSTFVGIVYGVLGSLVILACASAYTLFRGYLADKAASDPNREIGK